MNDQYRGPKMNTGIIHLIGEVGAGIIFREYSEKKIIRQQKINFSVLSGNKKIGRNAMMKEEGN